MKILKIILAMMIGLASPEVLPQNAPVTTAGTITSATPPGPYALPVTVTGFINVAKLTYTITYNNTIVDYLGITPNPALSGMTVTRTTAGIQDKLVINWQSTSNYTLPDLSTVLSINFNYDSSSTYLTWATSGLGNACKYWTYSGSSYVELNSTPKASYFITGGIGYKGAPLTSIPAIGNAVPGTIAVPVTVSNFDSIQVWNIAIEFDQNVLTYQSFTINPIFTGEVLAGTQMGPNGKLILTVSCPSVGDYDLPDGSTLFTAFYNYTGTGGNYSLLTLYDNGSSCDFLSNNGKLIDFPTSSYYQSGSIHTLTAPKVFLPSIGNAVPMTATDVPVISRDFANIYSFNLTLEYDTLAASFTGFTPHPQLASMTVTNTAPVGTKRKLVIAYTGSTPKTLPDSSSIVDLDFLARQASTNLTWITSDASSCRFNDASGKAYLDFPKNNYYRHGFITPKLAPFTAAWYASPAPGATVTMPVKAYQFSNIGYFNLTLDYDPGSITFQGASLAAAIGGTFITSTPSIGRIVMNWTGTAATLPNETDLINLSFLYNSGTTPLAWYDNGTSCKYAFSNTDPAAYDEPSAKYYVNGYIGPDPLITDFIASNTNPLVDYTVVMMTDATTGGPQGWYWTFTPDTYTYVNNTGSISQHPQLQFNAEGTYSAILVTRRGMAGGIKARTGYINASAIQPLAVNCPAPAEFEACLDQAVINTEFYSWVNAFGFTGGCNATATDLSGLMPPDACTPVVITVEYIVEDECQPSVSCSSAFTILPLPTGLWTGAVSSAWNLAANWNDGKIPIFITDVVIPEDAAEWPEFTGNLNVGGASCATLTVEINAYLTVTGNLEISPGGNLHIVGNVIVTGTIQE